MKWFDKWLTNRIDKAYSQQKPVEDVSTRHVDAEPILNFRIYSAQNGKVLEFNTYNRSTDKHKNAIYIINNDEDIAEKISKCVTMELLK